MPDPTVHRLYGWWLARILSGSSAALIGQISSTASSERASTTLGSNWLPAPWRSATSAWGTVSWGAEGRGEVMAVTASHTAITRAPRGIWSPAFPSGFPLPSRRSWVTIVGMGVLYLLMPLGMFFNRSLRQMDTRRRDAPGPAPAVE